MAILSDRTCFYNRASAHDSITEACARWVDHYNFMASIPWNTKAETEQYLYEMTEYLCYDV
jgi:hypothetical protein